MYSRKNQIKICKSKILNNFSAQNHKKLNSSTSTRIINNNSSNLKLISDEDNKRDISLNNDCSKENYYSIYPKKIKNSFISYYSKKKFMTNHSNKPQISNYIMHSEGANPEVMSLERIKKNITYKIKNPRKDKSNSKSKSKSKNNYNDLSVSKNTLNKNDLEEYLNTTNLNNNTSTIFDYNTHNVINNRINLNRSFEKSINLSRYYDNNNFSFNKKKGKTEKNKMVHQSSSNASKGVSFIMDYSNYDNRDNIFIKSPIDMNKFTLNSSNDRNAKSPMCSYCCTNFNETTITSKRKKGNAKTPNKKGDNIQKQIEIRKKKFEKMREIEKNIKNYFLVNGISLKNRELYHQSAIMIQSTFRSYFLRKNLFKKLNNSVGMRLVFDLLAKFINPKLIDYFEYFCDNAKKVDKKNLDYEVYNQEGNLNELNERKDNILKIEECNCFNIINNNKNSINKNLLLLNEKIENKNKELQNELNKLRLENEKLIKENDIFKSKDDCYSSYNNYTKNKITDDNIHKNNENIENVSLELKQIEYKRKSLNISLLSNMKKDKNDKQLLIQNYKKNFDTLNDNYYLKKLKSLYLKSIINKKAQAIKEYKRQKFHNYLSKINKMKRINDIEDNLRKDELIKMNKFKNVIGGINYKLMKYVYVFFIKMCDKYIYSNRKINRPSLYIPKSKIKASYMLINDISMRKEEISNKEKILKIKYLVKNKIKEERNYLHKRLIKFYYQSLLSNNIINNNSIINIINTKKNKNYSCQNNNNYNNFSHRIKNNELLSFKDNESKIKRNKVLQKLVNNNYRKYKVNLRLLFYKFYYNGIIFSLQKNYCKIKQKSKDNNNIYIRKGFEYKKNHKNINNE